MSERSFILDACDVKRENKIEVQDEVKEKDAFQNDNVDELMERGKRQEKN